MKLKFLMVLVLEAAVLALLTFGTSFFGTWVADAVGADPTKPVIEGTLTLKDGSTVEAFSKEQLDHLTETYSGQIKKGNIEYGASEAEQVSGFSTSCFSLVAFGAWVFFHHRQQIRAWLRPTWRAVGYGLLAAVVASSASAVSALLMDWIGVQVPRADPQGGSLGTIPMFFVVAAIVAAPIAEELYWRGRVFELVGEKFGQAAALILTSLGFALIHNAGVITLVLIPVGLVLGYVRHKSGSLVAPIVGHAAVNGFTLIASLMAGAKI